MILAAAVSPETYSNAGEEIAQLRSGDPAALTALLSRYQQRLYRFLLRLVHDPALAEDLFQQTWLRVMEKISSYDSRSRFDSWLFSVAHNLAVDYLRRQRSKSLDVPDEMGVTAGERLRSGGPDALDSLLETERSGIMLEAMQELPEIYREVLSLRFEDGMKLENIAEVADIPLSTVKSRLHRALECLRDGVERRFRRKGRQ